MQTSLIWLWMALTATASTPMQDLSALAGVAHEYLSVMVADEYPDAGVSIKVNAPDPRLRLQACQQPLEPFMSSGNRMGRTVSVGISCTSPKPWKIYLRAQVSIVRETVVAKRSITKGEILTPADLSLSKIDSAAMGEPAYTQVEALVGMEATRTITAGRAIRAGQVRAPQVVQRGDVIVLLAGTESLEVRMAGKALSSGAVGDSVSVRNNAGDRTLQGRVVAPGMVRMR